MVGAVVAIWKYDPADVINAGYVATGAIVALVIGTIGVPPYVGRGHLHIFHVFLTWPNRVVHYRSMYLNFEETVPVGRQLDIMPLMKMDEKGRTIPKWFGNTWLYPYLTTSAFDVDVPKFGPVNFELHLLPYEWNDFLGTPQEMPDGAELWGEVFTHPSSVLLVSLMAPFPIKHQGVEIPVFLGAFSDKSARKISADWIPTMREAARYMLHFDQVLEENQKDIYPFKEIEMQGSEILTPEAKAWMEEKLGKKRVAPTAK